MIRQLRSAKRVRQVLMFFLIIVIIPSFVAFYGWSDYSRTRGDGGQVAQPAVVKYGLLDKVEITHNDISNAENSLKGQYAQYARSHDIPVEEAVLGKLADPKDQLNQALNLEALRRYAKEHGITATSEEAVAALQARFTPEQREQYLDYLQRQGMSFERQVEELKAQLLLSKAVESINSQVRVTNYEAWLDYQLKNERLIADYLRLDAADYRSSVTVEESELKDWFTKNQQKFQVPDQVNYSFVLATKDQLKTSMTVTDDEVTSHYEANKESYRLARTAVIRQIFLKKPTAADLGTTAADSLTSAIASAKSQAEDISQRAMKGEDFAALADKYNQERMTFPRENISTNTTGLDAPTTAGGMIGEVSESRMKSMLGETWTSSVFNLQPGGISRPIEVPRGFYVSKLESIKEGRIQSLAEVRPVVVEKVKDEKVGPMFDKVGELITEAAQQNTGLQRLAQLTSNTVEETGKIDKSATFFPGIGLLGDFAEIIGDLQKGGRSDVLSDTNRHLVIEIKEEFPAHLPELTEVREKVEKAFKDMKAVEIAKTTAEKLKAKATNFDQFQAAVVELGTTFTKSRPFTRKDVATVLGPVAGFLQDTAGAHKGDVLVNVLGTKAEPTGYVVWHLSQVTEPSKAEFARELFTITREIQTQKESVLLQEFFRKKQKELSTKLKINNPNYD